MLTPAAVDINIFCSTILISTRERWGLTKQLQPHILHYKSPWIAQRSGLHIRILITVHFDEGGELSIHTCII